MDPGAFLREQGVDSESPVGRVLVRVLGAAGDLLVAARALDVRVEALESRVARLEEQLP